MEIPDKLHCHPDGKTWLARKGKELILLLADNETLNYPYRKGNLITRYLNQARRKGYKGDFVKLRKQLEALPVCNGCSK